MKKILSILMCVVMLIGILSLSGCNSAETKAEPEAAAQPTVEPAKEAEPAKGTEPTAVPAEEAFDLGVKPLVPDGKYIMPIEASGPNGEPVVGIEEVIKLLGPEDVDKIKAGNFTAVVCMHSVAEDWSQLQIKGITTTLEKFGIKVLTVADGKRKIEQQVSDIENAIQLKPNLLFTLPLDKDALQPVLRKAADNGVKIVFIDSVVADFNHPKDYAGVVQADNYVISKVACEILADNINKEGEVALIHYKHSLPHTDMRSKAARETFAKFPNIKVVAEQGVESTEEAAKVIESLLVAHPDIKAIWTCWDALGMAGAAVAENLGKKVVFASPDLSRDSAYSIASGGLFIGSGAQHPYDQGVAEALIGIAAVAGKETPQYVLVPGEKVTKENIKTAWENVFHEPLMKEIDEALKQ